LVERETVNFLVAGSSPALGALKVKGKDNVARQSKRYVEEKVQEMQKGKILRVALSV
jgi:hypothetical protein